MEPIVQEQPTMTPAIYRQRMGLVALALIGAQVMYLVLALCMRQGGFKPPANSSPQQLITVVLFCLGLIAAMASFGAVRYVERQLPPQTDFLKTAIGIGRVFFIGFAVSEIAAIAGLMVFFLYGNMMVLVFLLCVTALSIGIHYLRLKSKLDEIVRR